MANKPMKTINFGGEDIYYLNPDFENIDNSPFETIGGNTLTWDGNTGGLEIILDMYYKISDAIPTAEDLANYNLTLNDGTTASNVDAPAIVENHVATLWEGAVQIIFEDTEADGIPFKKGVYFYNDGEAYVTSLTINSYTGFTTTKLKEEYIPVDYIKQLIAEVTGK